MQLAIRNIVCLGTFESCWVWGEWGTSPYLLKICKNHYTNNTLHYGFVYLCGLDKNLFLRPQERQRGCANHRYRVGTISMVLIYISENEDACKLTCRNIRAIFVYNEKTSVWKPKTWFSSFNNIVISLRNLCQGQLKISRVNAKLPRKPRNRKRKYPQMSPLWRHAVSSYSLELESVCMLTCFQELKENENDRYQIIK